MASNFASDDLATICDACCLEKGPCYHIECWIRGKSNRCEKHKSDQQFLGVDDTHVIIVAGGESFNESCKKLQTTLKDPKLLGLSDDNVSVYDASPEKKVWWRLLSLKLRLQSKIIDKACSHVLHSIDKQFDTLHKKLYDVQFCKKLYDIMRQIIVKACKHLRKEAARDRWKRRIATAISENVVRVPDIRTQDLLHRLTFELAKKRIKDLNTNFTISDERVAYMVMDRFHLWKHDALAEDLKKLRESERCELENKIAAVLPEQYSVKDLGLMVDECFRTTILTSCLPVLSEDLKPGYLGLDEPKILRLFEKKQLLCDRITECLKPLPNGLLWYYYCGTATGRGDDELDDEALPKALLEATGQLVANMIVTLDCCHADANLPNIVHFVGDDPVYSTYTAITSCTARQKASHGELPAFTEFFICGLNGAIEECRSVFRRCFSNAACGEHYCDACNAFQVLSNEQCEICNKFRSSARQFRSLADVFAFVKSHLCLNRMHPIMRQSRQDRILPIVKAYQNASTSSLHTAELASDPARVSKSFIREFSESMKLKKPLDAPNITSISKYLNAHIIIVSGAGTDANIFRQGCLELQDTLRNPQFASIHFDNVSATEAPSPTEVQLRVLSLLLHLKEKVIDRAYSRASASSDNTYDKSELSRNKIVEVCNHVQKRLALTRCLRRNTFSNRERLFPESVLEELLNVAWTRAEKVKAFHASQEQNNDKDKISKLTKKIAKRMLQVFRLWSDDKKENYAQAIHSEEKIELQKLADYFKSPNDIKYKVEDLGIEVDKCFRELISTPFLPVSSEAISNYPMSDVIMRDSIVDLLRPLDDELLWYHYCGHGEGRVHEVLDDNVLPKALLEATGQLVANLIVTLDCCYAEANIPDIAHFMDDRLCSSFSVLASCTARQKSVMRDLPTFTQLLIYGLKNASESCQKAFDNRFTVDDCKNSNCLACRIIREQENSCETCLNFRFPPNAFHTLADIYHFIKAHLCAKRMYPLMRQSAVNYSIAVAHVRSATSTSKKLQPLSLSPKQHQKFHKSRELTNLPPNEEDLRPLLQEVIRIYYPYVVVTINTIAQQKKPTSYSIEIEVMHLTEARPTATELDWLSLQRWLDTLHEDIKNSIASTEQTPMIFTVKLTDQNLERLLNKALKICFQDGRPGLASTEP